MMQNPRKMNLPKVFTGKDFIPLDSNNANTVNFIAFRIWNNNLEVQYNPSGNPEDLDPDLWVPIVDMGVTTVESLKKKLTDLIEVCRIRVNEVPQGMAIGQWKPDIVNNFSIQINTAEIPLLSQNPSVIDLSKAYNKLVEDKKKFEMAKNTAVSLVKDRLYVLILECQQISDNAITAEGVSGYYDPDDKMTFNKHIETALYTYNDKTAVKRQVEEAIVMLTMAKNNFLNSLNVNINTTALQETITKANTALSNATVIEKLSN